ncbi:unnamed protein product [Sphagnum troendelagicum]|uniref:Uncharacterized protein n=1 Tax=Sphagnum troendelagicum TaxID=128251 RepID=A0ABP0V2F2_9BRYO
MAPAINVINIILAQLQARSLLIGEQETFVQNLLGTIIAMFEIKIGDINSGEACEDESYVQQGLLCISAVVIVNHIKNQGSFMCDCYERLEETDQQDVINHITTYMMVLIAGLQLVKVEWDGDNRALDKDASPVLLAQLSKLRHGVFLKDVLDLFQ